VNFETRIDGGPIATSSGQSDRLEFDQGEHSVEVRAIDEAGNVGPWRSATVRIDTTEPDTEITTAPGELSRESSASFAFKSSESATSFECRLDSADASAWEPCASTKTYSGLGEGGHIFAVRATDKAGNVDASPAQSSFAVDSQPPSIAVSSGPSGAVADPQPVFGFTAEAGASLRCSLDRGSAPSWGACSSTSAHTPAAGLGDGGWVFRVEATDAAGNSATASRSFAIDTTAPDTRIDAGPSAVIAKPTATVEFSTVIAESGATFQCRLDSAGFTSCSSPVVISALAEGAHTFEVRARDSLGNTDPTPATRTFVVDYPSPPPPDRIAPETTLTQRPKSVLKVKKTATATFGFAANEPGASFRCMLDRLPPALCSSPTRYRNLKPGRHSFAVGAVDAAGNVDASPSTFSFTVKKKRKRR
jgi:hypothetical protein